MKKIESHLGEHLKPVKLYKEDILELHRVLSRLDQEVKVRVNEFELDSIDELDDISVQKVSKLGMSTHGDNYVSVNFNENSIWLYANDDKPSQKGIFQELKELLKSKRDFLSILFHMSPLSGFYTGLSFWFIFDAIEKDEGATFNWVVGLFVLTTGLLWSVLGLRKSSKNF